MNDIYVPGSRLNGKKTAGWNPQGGPNLVRRQASKAWHHWVISPREAQGQGLWKAKVASNPAWEIKEGFLEEMSTELNLS